MLAMLGAVAVGCTRGGDAPSARTGDRATADQQDANKQLVLAVIPKSTGGEFWETVEQGATESANELGVTIRWEGPLAETEIAEQNKIIENMMNLGVDGMALAPLNRRAMRKPVESVVSAGIPVVVFDSGIDGDAHESFVATDNKAGGALAAKHLIEQLDEDKNRVFVLRYLQGTGSTEERAEGFMDTAKAGGLEIAADPYCEDGTVAGAIKASANALEAFVKGGRLEIDGIFASNLYSTLGMSKALDDLRQSGVQIDVVFVGFDTDDKLLEELKQGKVDALVAQNPRRMGRLAVETLVKHLRGENVEPIVDTGVELVTQKRLENEPAIRKLVGLE